MAVIQLDKPAKFEPHTYHEGNDNKISIASDMRSENTLQLSGAIKQSPGLNFQEFTLSFIGKYKQQVLSLFLAD